MHFSIDKYYFKTDPILEGLPVHELKFIKSEMKRIELKKGKVLFKEGAYSNGLYILRKGKVKIFQTNRNGKEQIAYIYKKGDVMGHRPLLSNSTHPATAATLEDSVFSFIPRSHFLNAIEFSPGFSRKLLVNLSLEFSVWINTISVFAQQPVKERVALSLLILNEKYRKKEFSRSVNINLSRENLANYVGTTVETLVRMLRQFKDERSIIAKGRKITVINPAKLQKHCMIT